MSSRLHILGPIGILAVVLSAILAPTASAWNTNLSTSASTSVTVGGALRDTATLTATSGISPTGTITFKLYGPNDSSCKTEVGAPVTDAVSGSGNYLSPSITPSVPGTYRWQASYSGDTHNLPSGPTTCGEPAETAAVTKSIPGLSTAASGSVRLGEAIRDRAHLTGGLDPTGTITFTLYGPNDSSCKTQVGTALTATVNGDGEYSSPPVVPAIPGSYRWVASYSGDTDNAPVAPTPCGEPAEATVIGQVMPVLSTTVSANVTLGGAVRDTANLSGGSNPTGTITFKLYGPNDSSCKTQVGTALIVTVNGNGEYASPPITPSTPGTYNWVASYSGDTDNAPVAPTPCGEPAETTVVSRVQLVIGTTAGGSVTLGEGLHDTANLSGGSNPTGTITFKLYGQDDTDCTAQVGEAVSVTVNANGSYTSPAITPTTTGTYHWVASYSGDGDNAPAGPTPCNDPNESASVQPKPAPGMTIVKTQRLAGSEDGYQRTPLGVTIGQEIAYQMLVENTGNMPLALSLSDAVCDGGTLSGPTGEMEAGQMLTPGGQAIYSCTHVALSGDGSTITNTATVTGTPPKGHPVGPLSSSVLADVASQGVLPAKSCVSGTVTLNGAAGCTRRPFKAKLSAAGVVKVTFYLDGRKLRTMTSKEARSGQLLIGIDPVKLAYGVHRLTAKIELTCGHKQIMRTLIFIHCRPPVVKPTFTG